MRMVIDWRVDRYRDAKGRQWSDTYSADGTYRIEEGHDESEAREGRRYVLRYAERGGLADAKGRTTRAAELGFYESVRDAKQAAQRHLDTGNVEAAAPAPPDDLFDCMDCEIAGERTEGLAIGSTPRIMGV